MKKCFLVVLVAILYSAVGCKKSAEKVPVSTTERTTTDIEKIRKDLQVINAKYLGPQTTAHKTTAPNGWAVAGADVAAFGLGVADTWAWCATGWGGLLAGVVITCATASASYNAYHAMVIPNNDRDDQKARIIQMVGTYQIPNPHNNPYEGLAQGHNEKVKILCQNSVQLNTSTLMYRAQDLTALEDTAISTDSTLIGYNAIAFLTPNNIVNQQTGQIDLGIIVNNYFPNDQFMQNFLNTFFSAYSQMSDDSTAIALINDYEEYFIDPQLNITDKQRASALGALAVGKYSTAMWHDALTNF